MPFSGMDDSPLDAIPDAQLGGGSDEPLSFVPPASLGGGSDETLATIPGGSLGGGSDGAVDIVPSATLGGGSDSLLDIIPGDSLGGGSDSVVVILVAATGPLISGETLEADVVPPTEAVGPLLLEEIFEAVIPPPSFAVGPFVSEMYEETPSPPIPPVPPVVTPQYAPGALIREYAPNLTESVTVQGGPIPTVYYTALNTLTPAQWLFLARRQFGADGAIPQAQVGRFTGPAYPFGPSWALTLGPKSDLEVIFTSICNIITTVLGTLPYAPLRGSEDPNLVFEPNDSINQGLIRYFTRRDLTRQEPRAKILTVRTVVPADDPHRVVVTVAFQIVGDPDGRVFSAPIDYNTLSLAV